MSSSKVVVTIKGSVTPCVFLPRGEVRTVLLTDRIQKLIDKGYITVLDRKEVKPVKKSVTAKPSTTVVIPPSNG